mgnify:CR=1 FL=1
MGKLKKAKKKRNDSNWMRSKPPEEGDRRDWNLTTQTGYEFRGGKWVQIKNGEATGYATPDRSKGDFYHDATTGKDMRWHPGYGKYMPSHGADPAQFITRPIRATLKAIKRGYVNNPGVLGILDPRVHQSASDFRKTLLKEQANKKAFDELQILKKGTLSTKEQLQLSKEGLAKYEKGWRTRLDAAVDKEQYFTGSKSGRKLLRADYQTPKKEQVKIPPPQKGFLGLTRITDEQGKNVPLHKTFSDPLGSKGNISNPYVDHSMVNYGDALRGNK